MQKMEAAYQVSFSTSSGNDADKGRPYIDEYPALFSEGRTVPGLIVVGASDITANRARWSQGGPGLDVYAPGADLGHPGGVATGETEFQGTSYGMRPSFPWFEDAPCCSPHR